MRDTGGEPRAVLVLVVGDREIPFRRIEPATRCDLGLIDDILRLRLAATRLGWGIRLTHVDHDVRGLLELIGLADCLEI